MKFLNLCLTLQTLAVATAFAPAAKTSSSSSSSSTQLFNLLDSGASPGYTSKTAGWEMEKISPTVRIEGQTRHTFDFFDASREMVQVAAHSAGRPVNCDVELWIGPDWTPAKLNAYSEDGKQFPIQTLIGTRNKVANIEIRNTASYEMPLEAACSYAIPPLADAREEIQQSGAKGSGRYIEGGSYYMHAFGPEVDQLQVLLKTDGKMLNAVIELLNGPNNIKQEFEIFTNNGELNALFVVFETLGSGYSVRVKNLAPVEFPCEFHYRPSKIGNPDKPGAGWN